MNKLYSSAQQIALIALRTLIGWHFLYEGYYKFRLPGWSADGAPMAAWSSAGYLKAATGPLGKLFQWMANSGWIGWMNTGVKIGLVLVGLSLMLGLLTRLGCWGALLLLALFYLTAIPMAGTQVPGSEGAYLIVNKTLIEAAAVVVLLVFNTGAIAGLDLFWQHAINKNERQVVA
ncbi:MAG: DoxX family membrane protein [Acidobacteria bacterium]|nr:DoxX family membrane protein [Acidobacteriota bacterium]